MIKRLLKEIFKLWGRKRWLKSIDKELVLHEKHRRKSNYHKYIAEQMLKEYDKNKRDDNNA